MLDVRQNTILNNPTIASAKLKNSNLSFRSLARNHIFIALLFFFGITANAQVKSSVDSTNIKIGEEIKYSIEVLADSTDKVLFPEGQSFLPLELLEAYKTDTTFEQSKYRLIKKYGLTKFDSGRYTIPRQAVILNGKPIFLDSVSIVVRDVVVDTTKQKMYDIKSAIEVDKPPFNFLKLLYWIVPILLIIGLIIYLLFRRKKRKEAQEKQLPPYEEALVALQTLDSTPYLKEHKSKEYYSNLTEIVKRYLDREVDETALESTSDELIERLQMHKDAGHFDLNVETIQQLDAVLKRADLVKFARLYQMESQAQEDRNTIEQIITHTHDAIPEPTEEEKLQNEIYAEEQRKKRKNKRIIYGVVGGILVIMITVAILIGTLGYSYLKDNLIGHPIKELAEGRWVKSEYGNPAVIIETPKVLVRGDLPLPQEAVKIIKSNGMFAYGSLLSQFYVMVNTTQYKQQVNPDLDVVMEAVVKEIEQKGVANMVLKKEEFETGKGIKGLKGFGTFNVPTQNGKSFKSSKYEILLFAQAGGLQQIMIAYPENDVYAEDVVNRITNSIELEVGNAPQQSQNQQDDE